MPPDKPATQAKWFDIWAAGVAINTMCVQHGFTGIVKQLGKQSSRLLPPKQVSYATTGARGTVESIRDSEAHRFSRRR